MQKWDKRWWKVEDKDWKITFLYQVLQHLFHFTCRFIVSEIGSTFTLVDLVFINLNSVERCGLVTEYRLFKTIIYFLYLYFKIWIWNLMAPGSPHKQKWTQPDLEKFMLEMSKVKINYSVSSWPKFDNQLFQGLWDSVDFMDSVPYSIREKTKCRCPWADDGAPKIEDETGPRKRVPPVSRVWVIR